MLAEPSEIVTKTERAYDASVWFVREVLFGRRHALKFLFAAIVFGVFGSPSVLNWLSIERSKLYFPWIYLCVLMLLIVVAGWIVVRTTPIEIGGYIPPKPASQTLRLLYPFTAEDKDVFARLQRHDQIRDLVTAVKSDGFRFGIITGESGSGKSSFLQAGIEANLRDAKHRVAYIVFSNADPLGSILQKLRPLAGGEPEISDARELLRKAARSSPQPLVLMLDQFEQLYLHHGAGEKAAVYDLLVDWYRNDPLLPLKVLICIREDYHGRLLELQHAMGYTLTIQNDILLRRFEATEAADILAVMAEDYRLPFNRAYVTNIIKQQLADRRDGTVSPADLQIVGWLVCGAKIPGFTQQGFKSLGGVEGALGRYLEECLKAAEATSLRRRDIAVKCLLVLSDLDRGARCGILTQTQIDQKLGFRVPSQEIADTLDWLSGPQVRLVHHVANAGYQLAHDRLVAAVRKASGDLGYAHDLANSLLTRRVHEYLDNGESSRYLIPWGEWRTIWAQRPFLVWGDLREAKDRLLRRSRKRCAWRAALGIVAAITIAACLMYSQSDVRQVHLIASELPGPLGGLAGGRDYDSRNQYIAALIRMGQNQDAKAIVKAFPKYIEPERAISTFVTALKALSDNCDAESASWFVQKAKEMPNSDYAMQYYPEFPIVSLAATGKISEAVDLLAKEDTEAAAPLLPMVIRASACKGSHDSLDRVLTAFNDYEMRAPGPHESPRREATLVSMAEDYALLGKPLDSKRIIVEILQQIRESRDSEFLGNEGERKQFAKLLGRVGDEQNARWFASTINVEDGRCEALADSAATAFEGGNPTIARSLVAEAESLVTQLELPDGQFACRVAIYRAWESSIDSRSAAQARQSALHEFTAITPTEVRDERSSEWVSARAVGLGALHEYRAARLLAQKCLAPEKFEAYAAILDDYRRQNQPGLRAWKMLAVGYRLTGKIL